ncbi:NADH-quinone oxidoreductase subunit B family protein [Humitalea sp. 24SJ18S-53]|uniref:NADH-quinone oxidoreductase subunit B family protein n=1 Tax=Humitalea sp. 24SJ18S-53 TaxID=3422307 RepID=UPI003D669396
MLWPRLARSLLQRPLAEPVAAPPEDTVAALVARLEAAAGVRLGRSLAIRHVDAGSCNGCELEVHATANLLHDLERFGLRFVASPRHADVLLVTGPTSRNMAEALAIAYAATPDPKWVVAAGDCAVDGGVFKGSGGPGGYAIAGGTDSVVPVDLMIPGCPPSPMALVEGLLALLAANEDGRPARRR